MVILHWIQTHRSTPSNATLPHLNHLSIQDSFAEFNSLRGPHGAPLNPPVQMAAPEYHHKSGYYVRTMIPLKTAPANAPRLVAPALPMTRLRGSINALLSSPLSFVPSSSKLPLLLPEDSRFHSSLTQVHSGSLPLRIYTARPHHGLQTHLMGRPPACCRRPCHLYPLPVSCTPCCFPKTLFSSKHDTGPFRLPPIKDMYCLPSPRSPDTPRGTTPSSTRSSPTATHTTIPRWSPVNGPPGPTSSLSPPLAFPMLRSSLLSLAPACSSCIFVSLLILVASESYSMCHHYNY
jgi:hypothetical protein